MATMPALVLTAPGQAEWTDVDEPALTGPGQAIVRPLAVATCDLDTAVNAGAFPLPLPYALGHEFVGEVTAVGDEVSTVRVGDRVAVPFQINCGSCTSCRKGLTGSCSSVARGSGYGLGVIGGDTWGAALTERVLVPYADAMLLPFPAGVDPAMLASLDNLPDAWRTVGPYLPELAPADRRVLIIGGGSIGLYAVAIARALDAEVSYVDRDERRAAVAAQWGATVLDATVLDSLATRVGRFPVTVSTGGSEAGLIFALRRTEPGGICTDTGIFLGDVALPLNQLYTTGVRFTTSRVDARSVLPAVLDLAATGRLDPSPVTATTATWSDAPAAWSAHRDKLVIVR